MRRSSWLIIVAALVGCEDGPSARGDGSVLADRGAPADGGTSDRGSPVVDSAPADASVVRDGPGTTPDGPPPVPPDGGADGPTPPADGSTQDGAPSAIWQPAPGTSWHWQLTGQLDTSVNAVMYDIDLFDHAASVFAALKAAGRVVICYFSAGSYEDWRPDAGDFPPAALGSKMSGWDEKWLDVRSAGVRSVMTQRLDLAVKKGCDGVEPDNVDGYANKTGFSLTAADQLDYNKFLAAEAHARGLSIGLKNDVDQVVDLVGHFDWALNEECQQYDECQLLSPFIAAGKAVFHVEYTPASKSEVCPAAKTLGFDSQVKHLDLDAWFEACW